jgi:hypothetical protein
MTDAVTRALTVLLAVLPARRRAWGEAVLAELAAVPPGRPRRAWIAGALWLIARESVTLPRVALAAAAAACLRLGWAPGSTDPATPVQRVGLLAIVVLLAASPLLSRTRRGAVADSRVARVVRAGGYVALWALLLVVLCLSRYAGDRFEHHSMTPADAAQWHSERVSGAVSGSLILFGVIAAYVAAILWLTSRRSPASPATLALGSACGVLGGILLYALMPAGSPVFPGAPAAVDTLALGVGIVGGLIAAGVMVARRAASAERARAEGALAGLLTGGAGALALVILTIPTMLLFPTHVPPKWANPDPSVPHGTKFEREMSVGDAADKYMGFLLLGPLLGFTLGVVGGAFAVVEPRTEDPRPVI